MTTEEFYARALLAALPIADAASKPSQSTTSTLAHDYAAALTHVFKRNRKTFHEES
jgi:hypothetical protein